jgi:tetratricopeptide (TPR) repeat protein
MKGSQVNGKVNKLFRRKEWSKARTILLGEQKKDPTNHWVLTQLGVTFYEQRQYQKALQLFLESQEIVPDCPLTLWNLAGTLDALGKPAEAVRIYRWLLQSDKSPEDDSCWESKEWTDLLKADCIYRLGVCFQHLGKKRRAEACYREYLNLLSLGIDGSYSVSDVKSRLRDLHGIKSSSRAHGELRKAIDATLHVSGTAARKNRRNGPPTINVRELVRAM